MNQTRALRERFQNSTAPHNDQMYFEATKNPKP